jgi:hypothetical protein
MGSVESLLQAQDVWLAESGWSGIIMSSFIAWNILTQSGSSPPTVPLATQDFFEM